MSYNESYEKHMDIFVNNFFVNGARNYIRKTTEDAPWLSMGIMENTNPEMFYSCRLFRGMNIFGGSSCSLGHGLIHGYLKNKEEQFIKKSIANLNALPAGEIIFYHDESMCGIEHALHMGLKLKFRPISLLEWLIDTMEKHQNHISPLNSTAAVQLPCSSCIGPDRNPLIDKLFTMTGMTRVERHYDYSNRMCCGARGYYGLFTGDVWKDTDCADKMVQQNVNDAKSSGANYIITLCPYCYSAIAPAAKEAGLIPLQIEGLVNKAIYGEIPAEGQVIIY